MIEAILLYLFLLKFSASLIAVSQSRAASKRSVVFSKLVKITALFDFDSLCMVKIAIAEDYMACMRFEF